MAKPKTYIGISCDPQIKQILHQEADDLGRSLSRHIVKIIESHLDNRRNSNDKVSARPAV
jgi:hypothetical protein